MAKLKVAAGGQVTFRDDVLRHLGIKPGDEIEIDLLPDGKAEMRADRRALDIADLQGFLRNRTDGTRLSIDEIGEATAEAGAGTPRLPDAGDRRYECADPAFRRG